MWRLRSPFCGLEGCAPDNTAWALEGILRYVLDEEIQEAALDSCTKVRDGNRSWGLGMGVGMQS